METSLKQKDPVCGMEVSIADSDRKIEFEGNVYYFCSEECQDKFLEDPGLYLEKEGLKNSEYAGW